MPTLLPPSPPICTGTVRRTDRSIQQRQNGEMGSIALSDAISLCSTTLGTDIRTSPSLAGRAPEDTPLRDLGFDSLSLLELAIRLEDEKGISLNPSQVELTPETTLVSLLKHFGIDGT